MIITWKTKCYYDSGGYMFTVLLILICILICIISLIIVFKKKKFIFLITFVISAVMIVFIFDYNSIPYKSQKLNYYNIAKNISNLQLCKDQEQKSILAYNLLEQSYDYKKISIDSDTWVYIEKCFELESEKDAQNIAKFVLTGQESTSLSQLVYNRNRLIKINEGSNYQTEYFLNMPNNWCYLAYQDDDYMIYSTYTSRERCEWENLLLANLPFGGDYTLLSIQHKNTVYLVKIVVM